MQQIGGVVVCVLLDFEGAGLGRHCAAMMQLHGHKSQAKGRCGGGTVTVLALNIYALSGD